MQWAVSPGQNRSNFVNAEYDKLYLKMRDMPNDEARMKIIRKMTEIIYDEVPWILFNHRIAFPIMQGWVRNYKRNPFARGNFKYYDIDTAAKEKILPLLK